MANLIRTTSRRQEAIQNKYQQSFRSIKIKKPKEDKYMPLFTSSIYTNNNLRLNTRTELIATRFTDGMVIIVSVDGIDLYGFYIDKAFYASTSTITSVIGRTGIRSELVNSFILDKMYR